MLRWLLPDLYLGSVLEVDAELLAARRISGLLLDLDSTLIEYRGSDFPPAVADWVRNMQETEVRLCVVSNGRSQRVQSLVDRIGVPVVTDAGKPLPFGVRRALARLELDRERVAMVGDQLFTDVLAGRLVGLFTILVRPVSTRDPWFTAVKRPLERLLLRRLA